MENDFSKELVQSLLDDRKHDRKWRNIRFFIRSGLILMILFIFFSSLSHHPTTINPNQKHYALVRLNGIIMPGSQFSANKVIPELEHAFSDSHATGVLLEMNSPGGSPVQSALIHDAILRLKKSTHKKVVVYGEDLLASGGYLIATAADKIYVNSDTLTGSIGVIMASFDLSGAIEKLGVTRRVIHAGKYKDIADPFKTMSDNEKNILQRNIDTVHTHFINYVKAGRKNHLKTDPSFGVKTQKDLFTGAFWNGSEAKKLGLVDDTGDLQSTAEIEFGTMTYIDYTKRPSLLDEFMATTESTLKSSLNSSIAPRVMAILH
jgi:protease IV